MSAPDWEGFGKAIMENWHEHCDVDAADKFEWALRFNILREIEGGFDPESHVDVYGGVETGDPWYELNTRATSEADELRAEIERLRDTLECIEGVGFDAPATWVGTDAEWDRRRARIMQIHARAALKQSP